MSDDEGDNEEFDSYAPPEAGMSSRRDVRIYRAFGVGKRRRGAVRNPPSQINEEHNLPEDMQIPRPGMPQVGTLAGPLREKPTAMRTMSTLPPRWRRNTILVGCSAIIVATLGPALHLGGLEIPLAIILALAVLPTWIHGKRAHQRRGEMDDVIEELRPYLGMERANRTALRIRYWHASFMPGTGRGTPRRIILYHWGKLRVNEKTFAPICAASFERRGWGYFMLVRYDSNMNRLIFAPAELEEQDAAIMTATETGPGDAEPLFDGDGVPAAGSPRRTSWRPPSASARLAAEAAEATAREQGVMARPTPEYTQPRPNFENYVPPQYTFDVPPPQPASGPRRRPRPESRDPLFSDGGLFGGDSLIGGDATGADSAADAAERRAEAAALFDTLGRTTGGRPEQQQQQTSQPRLRLVQQNDPNQ